MPSGARTRPRAHALARAWTSRLSAGQPLSFSAIASPASAGRAVRSKWTGSGARSRDPLGFLLALPLREGWNRVHRKYAIARPRVPGDGGRLVALSVVRHSSTVVPRFCSIVVLAVVPLLLATPVAAGGDSTAAATAVRCAGLGVLKSVFPNATVAGFRTRSQIKRASPREPFKDRKCGYWWTTYTGFRRTGATADVSVTLFKTRRDGLHGLLEGLSGPVRVLPHGVRVRTRVKTLATDSSDVSLVGNVLVVSTGIGPHDGTYSGRVATTAWMRIHRQIHRAVLALG